jgi:pimeloyl-ACP methyl ester carboxylesterase
MPAPVAMYRAGGFNVAEEPIAVPTLVINGADDGCARPFLCDGQEELFTSAYRAETWPRTGHFPHLEQPDRTARSIIDCLLPHLTTAP